jgi:hypothetical protein
MDYGNMIRRRAEERGILYLLHFTPFENLVGIVEHGLLPRTELDERGLGYTYTDPWRLDGRLDATSLSISDINWEMFDKKRSLVPQADWAIVYFKSSVLWTHDCRFCYRNAAHKDIKWRMLPMRNPDFFDSMFEDVAPVAGFKGDSWREERKISPELPTRVDAEVQVLERIGPELIEGVGVNRPRLAPKVQALMDGLNQQNGGDRNIPFQEF